MNLKLKLLFSFFSFFISVGYLNISVGYLNIATESPVAQVVRASD